MAEDKKQPSATERFESVAPEQTAPRSAESQVRPASPTEGRVTPGRQPLFRQ